jgi:hypothetical protein
MSCMSSARKREGSNVGRNPLLAANNSRRTYALDSRASPLLQAEINSARSVYLRINSAGFCHFVNSPFRSQRIVWWPNAMRQARRWSGAEPPSLAHLRWVSADSVTSCLYVVAYGPISTTLKGHPCMLHTDFCPVPPCGLAWDPHQINGVF